jgi:hypothetical protein
MGAGAARVQRATYPQSPFPDRHAAATSRTCTRHSRSAPARAIMDKSGRRFVVRLGRAGPESTKTQTQPEAKPQHFQLAIN